MSLERFIMSSERVFMLSIGKLVPPTSLLSLGYHRVPLITYTSTVSRVQEGISNLPLLPVWYQ